jgi:hypothetical protein
MDPNVKEIRKKKGGLREGYYEYPFLQLWNFSYE